MKIQIEGNEKKLMQLFKELGTRCKRDKLILSIIVKEIEIDDSIEKDETEFSESEKPKRGRKPNK